jgi:3-oxosteroid 1-dehydrogenase
MDMRFSKKSRRNFLKTGASTAAFFGTGFHAVTKTPDWDQSTDVVVVGCGGAGAMAALSANEAGASCIVLEKMPYKGGTTVLSGGLAWLPNNQLAAQVPGYDDSVAHVVAYLEACAKGRSNPAIMQVFAQTAPAVAQYLIDSLGVPFRIFDAWDYHPRYPGARRNRGLRPETASGGAAVMQVFLKALDQRRVTVLTSMPAERLVVDNKRRVRGVIAIGAGRQLRIEARKGVVLTTGGFGWNEAMKRQFLRIDPLPCAGQTGNTGDGIRLGMSVGADLGNMGEMCGSPVLDMPGLVRPLLNLSGRREGIMVNSRGRRFCNESKDYDTVITSFYEYDSLRDAYPNNPAYLILDQKGFERGPIPYNFCPDWSRSNQPELARGWIKKAHTLWALAERLKIDPTGLEETVQSVNAAVERGRDSQFERGEDPDSQSLKPLRTPPFYGVQTVPGVIDTMGGLEIDTRAQVLDVFGEGIAGLYAAGATAHQAWGFYYPAGGAFLGQNFVFGRIAGQSAAA